MRKHILLIGFWVSMPLALAISFLFLTLADLKCFFENGEIFN